MNSNANSEILGEFESNAKAKTQLLMIFESALDSVSAKNCMPQSLPELRNGRLIIIAVGKGAAAMMLQAQQRATSPFKGLVVTRYGHLLKEDILDPNIEIIEAGHPYPDSSSLKAASRALELAQGLQTGDQLLLLLSGGGSSLLASPAPGITLEDKQSVTKSLLQSGATISEINCVRKHLSRIKGGRLAVACGHARVATWIISDVPGDDPAFVSSGPTQPDSTTLADARDILLRYSITPPKTIKAALEDDTNETPTSDSLGLAGAETRIIARARDALDAAGDRARNEGYVVMDLGDQLQAEARHLGASHASLARRLVVDGQKRAIISGGETTVTVTNKSGKGGRNLEYLLSLAIALNGTPDIYALACDTDGIDGTEDAAGAIITPDTLKRARAMGLDADQHLAWNNAYLFFEALGDLIITGPTLTNVNDFRVIIINGFI